MNQREKNANRKAETILLKGFAFFVIAAILVAFAGSASAYVKRTKEHEKNAMKSIYSMMEIEMSKCALIGKKMQYAGADIKNELLPALKTHLYSLSRLNQACEDAFGIMHTPVGGHFMNKTTSALNRLEKDMASGYDFMDSLAALTSCLGELDKILKAWEF